jgi:hypothetical protein
MLPKEQQLSIMLSSGGEKWALKELNKSKSEGPSKENREIVEFLIWQAEGRDAETTIAKIAIEWNDAATWSRIVGKRSGFFLKQDGYTGLCDGWREFEFDGVRPV